MFICLPSDLASLLLCPFYLSVDLQPVFFYPHLSICLTASKCICLTFLLVNVFFYLMTLSSTLKWHVSVYVLSAYRIGHSFLYLLRPHSVSISSTCSQASLTAPDHLSINVSYLTSFINRLAESELACPFFLFFTSPNSVKKTYALKLLPQASVLCFYSLNEHVSLLPLAPPPIHPSIHLAFFLSVDLLSLFDCFSHSPSFLSYIGLHLSFNLPIYLLHPHSPQYIFDFYPKEKTGKKKSEFSLRRANIGKERVGGEQEKNYEKKRHD